MGSSFLIQIQQGGDQGPHLPVDLLHRAQTAVPRDAGDDLPAQEPGSLEGAVPAGGQIVGVHLVDVPLSVGGCLPAAEQLQGAAGRHIQIEDQVGPGQAQLVVLKVVQPAQKGGALLRAALGPLVDGIGGSVAVGEDQPPLGLVFPPYFFQRGVPVHRIESGGGVGIHIPWAGAEFPAQIHADEGG